jgi:predicted nucleic acid-binding protein
MFLDTTFLIDVSVEAEAAIIGRARRWIARNRHRQLWTTVISIGEVAAGFRSNAAARKLLAAYQIARLHPEIAYMAADIDRELMKTGERLGENDNWIAAFSRYYGEPLVSNDLAFDRVQGIRRIAY